MPTLRRVDAAKPKRRRPHRPFRSVATHGNGRSASASASAASGRGVEDMDDMAEERTVLRTSLAAQVSELVTSEKKANNDNGQNVADVSERDGCGGPASAPSSDENSNPAADSKALGRGGAKPPAISPSPATLHNSSTRPGPEGQYAKDKNIVPAELHMGHEALKRPVGGPPLDAERTARTGVAEGAPRTHTESLAQRNARRALGNRKEDGQSRPQLKSPPELMSKNQNCPRSSAAADSRVLESTSQLKSRWATPSVASVKSPPSPHLSRLQSNLANPESWIDALKKQTSPAPRPNEAGSRNDLQKHNSNACTSAKGGVAISNLEESYFFKTAPKPNPNRSVPNESGSTKSPRHTELSNRGGDEKRGLQREPPALKRDECSEATQPSNEDINGQLKQSASEQIDDEDDCPTVGNNMESSQSQGSSKRSCGANEDKASTGDDTDAERVKLESKKLAEERRKSEAKYQADLDRAIAASMRQQQPRSRGIPSAASEIIELPDSDDEDDSKMPAIQPERQPSAAVTAMAASSNQIKDNQMDENAQIEMAIKLSMAEAEKMKEYQQCGSTLHTCRKLNRDEFEQIVEDFVSQQGGFEKIEAGQLVKHGNANDMKKSCIAAGGGRNQTGAQYGRYSINSMWRLFDVLEGKADVNLEKSGVAVKDDCKKLSKRGREKNCRLDGLPGAKIKAFLDIGHGLGIQVLQAGWSLGVPSRGVEIMKDRHLIAKSIEQGVIDSLRPDYPDSTMVQLELADFSRAVVRDKMTNERDEERRRFLLFQDSDNQGNCWSNEVQKGLVIFINNAEEVFAARSNQRGDGACLDVYLANLFANMQVGGRMVTLTDVSCHLSQSSDWFQLDRFKSGSNAVSWGNSSVDVYVLTKLSDVWYCQNNKCPHFLNFGCRAKNNVVLENGDLCEMCAYCEVSAKRSTRLRKPSRKQRKEE